MASEPGDDRDNMLEIGNVNTMDASCGAGNVNTMDASSGAGNVNTMDASSGAGNAYDSGGTEFSMGFVLLNR